MQKQMNQKYKVMMQSRQGHEYEYICEAEDEFNASEKAYESININGWSNYQYMVNDVTLITENEE